MFKLKKSPLQIMLDMHSKAHEILNFAPKYLSQQSKSAKIQQDLLISPEI